MAATGSVAVIGGGFAGLAAAWELARAGVEVDLYEASDQLGGAVAPVTLAGVTVDAGAEAFAVRNPSVREFIAELGLADRLTDPNPAGAWLQLPATVGPLPKTGILGIPGDPHAADVVGLIGAQAAARAAEDLTTPLRWTEQELGGQEFGGQELSEQARPGSGAPSLGELVRDRMGAGVVDSLLTPITSGVHSAHPDDLPLSAAHPGLGAALLQEGSLARAVLSLRAAAAAGSAVQSLEGGMNTVVAELHRQLETLGVRIHLGSPVQSVCRSDRKTGFTATIPTRSAHPAHHEVHADRLVLAVDGPQAAALSGSLLSEAPELPQGTGGGVALVTVVLQAPELDRHSRGTGMLVAPGVEGIEAKAMTHITAKWSWAAQAVQRRLGPGHHIVRLSYGRTGDGDGALGYHSSDQQLLAAAQRDLPALFGLDLPMDRVLDATVVRWQRALPGGGAQREHMAALRARLSAAPGGTRVALIGSWFAGTGLAQVIPDARGQARRLLGT